jgi:hypothetical protein
MTAAQSARIIEILVFLGAVIFGFSMAVVFWNKVYTPIFKKLEAYREERARPKGIPIEIINEMYYADYLAWAAERGHEPYFLKL